MRAKPAVAFLAALGAVVAVLAGSPSTRRQSSPASPRRASASEAPPKVAAAFGRLPLHFEANVGQAGSEVRFLGRGSGYALFFTADEAVLGLSARGASRDRQADDGREASRSSVLRTRLVGANADPKVRGADELPGKANYFLGNDPRKWRRNVPLYARVAYEDVYPGIDLVYYGNQRQLEYDFVVAPGADPGRIRMRFEGARSLRLDRAGDLRIALDHGEVVHHAPKVLQRSRTGLEEPVLAQWVVSGQEATFAVGAYDASRDLVIDPVLVYSTYLGGAAGWDGAEGIAVDGSGAAYVAGYTGSSDFPTENPLQPIHGPDTDAFVAKFTPDGGSLIYSTFLGGAGEDHAFDLAIDDQGSAYVAGYTESPDFPVQLPYQADQPGRDAFVAKLTADGSALVYSTYLGGSGWDTAFGVALDPSRSAYVAGSSSSVDFPAVTPHQGYGGGTTDAFVAKFSPAGTALLYSTLLGGQADDTARGIAVDGAGAAYLTGETLSPDFPTQAPLQDFRGSWDAFVTKVAPDGSALDYSTYLGGTSSESGYGIAVDTSGSAYVTGWTWSSDFPTRNALQGSPAGDTDVFVSRLSAVGDALEYSTYLGGSGDDVGVAIAVDAAGHAHVTGVTISPDFPTRGPTQSYAGYDAFVSMLSPSGESLLFSTSLGGDLPEEGRDIALDGAGSVYVVGFAYVGFPTVQPFQTAQDYSDAFVVKIGAPPATNFYTVAPCRVSDTRAATGPFGGPALVAGGDRSFAIAGQCGIPSTARAVALNLTVTQPMAQGHLRVYPTGGGLPLASVLNYSAGQTRAGNGFFMLGTGGAITVHCNGTSGTAHLVVDVSGYFQ